jgi:hypothetical protein
VKESRRAGATTRAATASHRPAMAGQAIRLPHLFAGVSFRGF